MGSEMCIRDRYGPRSSASSCSGGRRAAARRGRRLPCRTRPLRRSRGPARAARGLGRRPTQSPRPRKKRRGGRPRRSPCGRRTLPMFSSSSRRSPARPRGPAGGRRSRVKLCLLTLSMRDAARTPSTRHELCPARAQARFLAKLRALICGFTSQHRGIRRRVVREGQPVPHRDRRDELRGRALARREPRLERSSASKKRSGRRRRRGVDRL